MCACYFFCNFTVQFVFILILFARARNYNNAIKDDNDDD